MKNQLTIQDLVSSLNRDLFLLSVNEYLEPAENQKEATPFQELAESLPQQNA